MKVKVRAIVGNLHFTIVPEPGPETALIDLFLSEEIRAGRRLILHHIAGSEFTFGWQDPPNGAEAAPVEAVKPCDCTDAAECAGGGDTIRCRIDEFESHPKDLLLASGYNVPKNRVVTNAIVNAIEADKLSSTPRTEGQWRHFIFRTIGEAFEEKEEDPQLCKFCEVRFLHPCTTIDQAEAACPNRGVVRRAGPPWNNPQ